MSAAALMNQDGRRRTHTMTTKTRCSTTMEGTTDVAMTTKIPSFTDGTCLALCTVPRWTASGSGWVGSVRWPHLPMDAALAGWRSENGGWGLTGCWIRGPVWSWRGRTRAGCRASWGVTSRTDYPDTLPGQPRGMALPDYRRKSRFQKSSGNSLNAIT